MDKNNGRRKRQDIEKASNEDSQSNSDEALEDRDVIADEDEKPISEESGEDLEADMQEDYKKVPELDRYEEDGLDDQDYSDIDAEEQFRVDALIDERLKLQYLNKGEDRRRRGLIDFSEDSEDLDIQRRLRQRNMGMGEFEDMDQLQESEVDAAGELEAEEFEKERFLDVEQARGKLHLWIKEPRTARYINRVFRKFLFNFRDENQKKTYENKIIEMCNENRQSLEVSYVDLMHGAGSIAIWVSYEPNIILPYLNDIAFAVACQYFHNYSDIHPEIFVKIIEFPVFDSIRELRYKQLNRLIKIKGVITRRSLVYSQLQKGFYLCKCGDKKGPIYYNHDDATILGACVACQSKGPFTLVSEESVYRNFQQITVQESPGSVQAGRVPRQKEVILLGDNIDIARPGDQVEITGVYTHRYDYILNVKHGFPIFQTIIEANHLKRAHESESIELPQADIDEIKQLSRRPDIANLIIDSVAPSIYGHRDVKRAIALSMFGGVHKDVHGKHKIRGDINVLVLGDPGTAKSQFLKTVEQTFHRCVYTTGKGASAVGLTASVKKDPSTREWMLEGGALVLADKGICLIDEFDKMNDYDRTSIHEAMEQQSISISKAGIVTTLQARCAVIACANPLGGRYKSENSFMDNVDLTDPILSRFDVLCVVKDEIDYDLDDKLATFVINNHIKNHPNIRRMMQRQDDEKEVDRLLESLLPEKVEKQPTISQDLLRKYIIYARQKCHPKLTGIEQEKIIKFYTDLRAESTTSGGMNVAVRHIESIIRMAEAHAKMHLREVVKPADIDAAISVMLQSFIDSQKVQTARIIRNQFKRYIINPIDNFTLLKQVLDKLNLEKKQFIQDNMGDSKQAIAIPLLKFKVEAKQYCDIDLNEFFKNDAFTNAYKIQGQAIIQI